MKRGCLFILAVWLIAGAANYALLRLSPLGDRVWIPILLGLGAALVAGNFASLLMAFKQSAASKSPASEWRDGQLVAVSGKIQPLRMGLDAPFSGKRVVIAEYEVKSRGQGQKNQRIDFLGFLMTPCTINTARGAVRLVGFPLLANIPEHELEGEEVWPRAARYLLSCKFKIKAANPFALLKELSAVLSDDDGDVRADFGEVSNDLELPVSADTSKLASSQSSFAKTSFREPSLDEAPEEEDDLDAEPSLSPQELKAEELADMLAARSVLKEQSIEVGAEVTVFGTYHQAKREIDVGSGMTNLSHQIHLGPISKVLGKNFRKSLFGLIFWSAAAVAGHYAAWHQAGIAPELEKLIGAVSN